MLSHLLFALKHEGVELAILAETLPQLSPEGLIEAIQAAPNGVYLRRLGYLYEAFVARLPFDPGHYVTGPAVRDSRWRVDFNGLGQGAS
ncbi:hypothetical protein [Halomonas salifodinae]|uniref:hypothetical protein n=1 Tax=Halomonas salifodinae TaxID=438745 RepID=UPI0033ABAAFD